MPAQDGDRVHLSAKAPFIVETVVSPEAKRRGLSGRPGLAPGHGMFFVFEEITEHTMWMSGMRFALDIVWLDEWLRVGSVNRACPPCLPGMREGCPTYRSRLPAKYAIEVAAGEADRLGLTEGAQCSVKR